MFVVLDDQERTPLLTYFIAAAAADSAIPDEDSMVDQRRDRKVANRRRGRPCHTPACDAAIPRYSPPIDDRKERRVGENRNDRAGKNQITAGLRQHSEVDAETGEDEGELADLGEPCRARHVV